ncbi:MAG: hypothetical protein HKO94_03685 [Flavobacteriaceae bacterium]|nr:hypothetical protein [Flavobacteriaceae bacterium]
MCNGGGPPKITITISATTANPFPPGLSDGVTTLPPGGPNDANFTTVVVPNQTVQFVKGGDVTEIAIVEGSGSDIFKTDPTAENNWTGVIGTGPNNNEDREYTINYKVSGHTQTYSQDPKLQMKKQ